MRWISFCVQKNLTVSVVILLVLLARMLLRNSPKKYSYALWSIVALRMLFNLQIPSVFSIFNYLPGLQTDITLPEQSPTSTFLPEDAAMSLTIPESIQSADLIADVATGIQPTDLIADAATKMQPLAAVVLSVWLFGMLLIFAKGIQPYLRIRRWTRTAVRLDDPAVPGQNVWECENISSPFVLGFFSSRIYLPFHMDLTERSYVLKHEQYHAKRRDPLFKLLAFSLLAIYWMNPLAWVSYYCFVRDQEMSCDEAVLLALGGKIKKEYSRSLLSYATKQRSIGFTPIAFGESDASRRIKNVLRFKEPSPRTTLTGIFFILVIGVVCLTAERTAAEALPENASKLLTHEVIPAKTDAQKNAVTKSDPSGDGNSQGLSEKMVTGNTFAGETYGVATTYADVSLPNAEAFVKAECEYIDLLTNSHFTEEKEANGAGRAMVFFSAPENCRVVQVKSFHAMKQKDGKWTLTTFDKYNEGEKLYANNK